MDGSRPRVALVLAAGRSTRMQAVTDGGSKLLIDVGGVSLIERTVAMVASEVDRVLVVVGYDGDRVGRRASRAARRKVEVVRAHDWDRGNGASLAAAEPSLAGVASFLVVVGDHLFSEGPVRALLDAGGPAVLVDPAPSPAVLAEATRVRVAGGWALAFGKQLESAWVDCGAFVLTPDVFACHRAAMDGGDGGLAAAVTRLAAASELRAVSVVPPAWWQDVDTPADLTMARSRVTWRRRGSGRALPDVASRATRRPAR